MKFLALLSSAAVASAQLVTYPNGAVAPAKTPEVLAAEAAHFAAKGVAVPAWGYAGAYPYAGAWNGAYNGLWNGAYAGAWNGAYNGYAGWGLPYAAPLVAHPNGAIVPADEPAVVAAKADHFAAHGLPVAAPVQPFGYAAGYPGLVAHPNGALVPAEPADVVAARADHLAAHA
jgi:hypothetical protein